jgi:hypothetical protein
MPSPTTQAVTVTVTCSNEATLTLGSHMTCKAQVANTQPEARKAEIALAKASLTSSASETCPVPNFLASAEQTILEGQTATVGHAVTSGRFQVTMATAATQNGCWTVTLTVKVTLTANP